MDAGTTQRPAPSAEGWRLWGALAAACLVAAWIPMLVSLRFPVYALDFWGVLSGNIGLSWLSPAALTGLAVAGIAREQGWSRPRLLGGVAGVVTGAVLLIGFVAWGASIEPRWADEMAITPAKETAETAPATPASLVRERAEKSRSVLDVLCAPGSEDTTFCVVTYEGPACQLWSVVDGEATALPSIISGASGSRTARGVRCGT